MKAFQKGNSTYKFLINNSQNMKRKGLGNFSQAFFYCWEYSLTISL